LTASASALPISNSVGSFELIARGAGRFGPTTAGEDGLTGRLLTGFAGAFFAAGGAGSSPQAEKATVTKSAIRNVRIDALGTRIGCH
jgi:hypothetical protein